MKLKTKNKNISKIEARFFVVIFFVLIQINFTHTAFSATIKAQEVIDLTNKSRVEAGLDPLIVNDKLTQAAIAKVNDMFQNQYFDHNSPQGLTPWDFIRSAGYEYRFAGENLAIDFITARGVHKALMESSSHRENILNVKYTEIGVAVLEGNFEQSSSIIIVEEFGSLFPKKEIPAVSIKELDIEITEKTDEVSNKSIKTDIKKENIKMNIQQESEEELNILSSNLNLINEEEVCLNKSRPVLVEVDFGGVCEAESAIYTVQGTISENDANFVFDARNNNYFNNKIQAEDNSAEFKNIIFINKALAGDTHSQNQRLVDKMNTGIIINDLYIKLAFFYTIIFFMLISSATSIAYYKNL